MSGHLAKRVDPSALDELFRRYDMALKAMFDAMKALGGFETVRDRVNTGYYWQGVILAGRPLIDAVMTMKEIPAGKTKAVELLARLFTTSRRAPESLFKWLKLHGERLVFLNQAPDWKDKVEGGEDTLQMFKVGPFTVHNTIGIDEKKLKTVKATFEKAIRDIHSLKVPGIDKVLYGDVYIVAKIMQARTLAFYRPQSDEVFIRPFLKVGDGEVHNLIHELGHRYLRKFASREMIAQWERHWSDLRYKTTTVEMPKVGDVLPVPLRGAKTPPIITGIEPGARLLLDTGGFVDWMALRKMLKTNATAGHYPTPYSATSADEHFCEALALKAEGRLAGEHMNIFEQIVERGEPAMKTAASTYVQISREELESWLGTLQLHSKWHLQQGKAGVYMLPLSDSVAVKLGSTIGTQDDAMGRGEASMQLALVSSLVKDNRGNPMVLNKKAQGQSHFARTLNWKTNWKTGIERMKDAYMKSKGFYDALAMIDDRNEYKITLLARIEAISGWQGNHMLSDFHTRVEAGGILTIAQAEVIGKAEHKAPAAPTPAASDSDLLIRMRELYKAAKAKNDSWLLTFLTSVGQQVKSGREPTEKQMAVLTKNFASYRI